MYNSANMARLSRLTDRLGRRLQENWKVVHPDLMADAAGGISTAD